MRVRDEDPGQVHWFDDDDRLRRLYDYCRQDVEVERELFDRLPPLSATEQTLWALSCKINERGFCVDRQFAEAARRIAQAAAPEIDAELAEITSGAVTGINQVARLLQWLQDQGCTAQKLDRKAIERQLEKEDLPPAVRRVLELRLRRCAGRRQEDRCAAWSRRCGSSCARRISLSWRIHRPLGR